MYYGCSWIKMLALKINTRIDTNEECIALCCEPVEKQPAVGFGSTAKETVGNFIKMHQEVVVESKKYANCGENVKRLYTDGCVKCGNYKLGEWDGDGLIHYVNLSMYPASCQCKCIYCDVHSSDKGRLNKASSEEYYQKMFDMLNYACEIGLIAEDALWQISSGEITIHPYKDRIYDLVENRRAIFFTNCFIFDERIAEILSLNPYSSINFSIDAGTPQTWFKIKGVDNFELVTDNLVNYYSASIRPDQITLKYIVLPGINDTLRDYQSLIEMMKILKINTTNIKKFFK